MYFKKAIGDLCCGSFTCSWRSVATALRVRQKPLRECVHLSAAQTAKEGFRDAHVLVLSSTPDEHSAFDWRQCGGHSRSPG